MEKSYPVAAKFPNSRAFREWNKDNTYLYSRISHPEVSLFENLLLTGSESGALSFCSGMAAISTLLIYLSKSYNTIFLPMNLYGGTDALINSILYPSHFEHVKRINIETAELPSNAKGGIIFLETPANPTLEVADIHAWKEIAAKRGCKIVVDNTLMTHALQDPIARGADYAVASATKLISGKSDSLGGVIWTRDQTDYQSLFAHRTYLGTIMSPYVASKLAERQKDLRTRVLRQSATAKRIYQALIERSGFARIYYPGCDCRSEEIVQRQSSGHGGCLITCTPSGSFDEARRLLDNLETVKIATSFGGSESTAQLVNDIQYTDEVQQRDSQKLPLIRFSVGTEGSSAIARDILRAWRLARGRSPAT